jgi:hypothetical protein
MPYYLPAGLIGTKITGPADRPTPVMPARCPLPALAI